MKAKQGRPKVAERKISASVTLLPSEIETLIENHGSLSAAIKKQIDRDKQMLNELKELSNCTEDSNGKKINIMKYYTHITKDGYKYSFKAPNYFAACLFAQWKFVNPNIIIQDNY